MNLHREEIAGLNCVMVRGATQKPVRQIAIFCHGFGAPGDDLVGLAPELISCQPSLQEETEFVFPAAPIDLQWELGFEGRAWWPINMQQLQQMSLAGDLTDLEDYIPPELADCRRRIVAIATQRGQMHRLSVPRWVIGGFSQGAMLAVDVALHGETQPSGLIVWSGTVICLDSWRTLASARAPLPIVQSHGYSDPILPFSGGERLRDLMQDTGHHVEFLPFQGPHTISSQACEAAARLLARLIQ
ncbi:MAG TPA: lysophospholipase [Pirellulaceae bacterium]|nr:lysophospholipase [Pirellulaceae bacterium]